MSEIGILILEGDPASQSAMRQVLDSEGWRVGVADSQSAALQQLATGDWTLVIASVATTGLDGPLFLTLRELALAPGIEAGRKRLRVLFIVPESLAQEAQPVLERQQLPYALKPFHFHDFLEKVSDLLLETDAIAQPIRRVRQEGPVANPQRRGRLTGREVSPATQGGRNTGMFASRGGYEMTEEELAEFERQQQEETQRKKKKKLQPGP